MEEDLNCSEYVDFNRLERWITTESTEIDFEREGIYTALNKLTIEAGGLPFNTKLKQRVSAKGFGLVLKEAKPHPVIPQRLYYQGLKKSEELIDYLYPLRDELGKLPNYLATYFDKLYQEYAVYLLSNNATMLSGKVV